MALELNPNDLDIHINRANVYRILEENEKAFEDYEKAIELL
ncbi:MAG: tetratricopeptide repeat protein [Candidatus Methanofastidiosum sp.]|nr:tetratricopeptide repeat protein [Methanofastidiosum sp.]